MIGNERSTFEIELNNKASFDKVFAPISGRFAPGARIIFTGCNLIEHGTPAEKLQVMKQVARNFGLTDGTIYMNQTIGKLLTRSAFQQPFYEQSTTGEKLVTLAIQATPYISLPALMILEHQANQGYTLRIKGGEARVYEDNFFNAEKGKIPLGERRGEVAASISENTIKALGPGKASSASTPAALHRNAKSAL